MKNVTIKKMADASNIPATLIRAVVKQSGGWDNFKQMARDLEGGGIDGGFHGFIYYTETVRFCKRHKREILDMARDMAFEFGQDMLEMILGFGCLRGSDLSPSDLGYIIYSGRDVYCMKDSVYNCLTWYAGEEVARLYRDLARV
jgi:hypothetical protein